MSDPLQKYLQQLMLSVEGLQAIIIADRDGVPIIKAHTEQVPEMALLPNYLATFSTAADQASKMGFGKNNAIVSMYGGFQVVQINKYPLMITLVAESSSNTGLLRKLEDPLATVLKELLVVES